MRIRYEPMTQLVWLCSFYSPSDARPTRFSSQIFWGILKSTSIIAHCLWDHRSIVPAQAKCKIEWWSSAQGITTLSLGPRLYQCYLAISVLYHCYLSLSLRKSPCSSDGGYTITLLEFSIDSVSGACTVILAHMWLMFIHTLISGWFGPRGTMTQGYHASCIYQGHLCQGTYTAVLAALWQGARSYL